MNFETILSLLFVYKIPALFLGTFFFGDAVVLAAAFLAGNEIWPLSLVFIISVIGAILSDLVWFYIGPRLFNYSQKYERIKKHSERILPKIEQLGNHPFHLLVVSKFIYGTRILTIIYLAWKKINLGAFIIYDLIGSILWLIVLIPIGYLAGKSVINLLPALEDLKYATIAILLLIIAVSLINVWIGKKFEKKDLP